jgi:hypothetical protein
MPDHFYTTDSGDFQLMKTRYGYQDDEIPVGGVETTQVDVSVPLFRLWTQATDNHFYTIDPTERDQFKANWYQYETIAGYVYNDDFGNPDRPPGLYPVYRLYKESINDYLYTMSDERAAAMQEHGYVSQKIAWYMYREDPVGRLEGGTPLLGAYRPSQLTLQADTGDQPVGEGAWMHTTVT